MGFISCVMEISLRKETGDTDWVGQVRPDEETQPQNLRHLSVLSVSGVYTGIKQTESTFFFFNN